MKPTLSPQDQEIIKLLKRLGTLTVEYPEELLAARRAAFDVQIIEESTRKKANGANKKEFFSQEQVIELLEGLKPALVEYPPELISARRAAFVSQVEQYNNGHATGEAQSQNPVIDLLGKLKRAPAEYPAELLSARRAAFMAQIQRHNQEAAGEEAPSQDQVIDLLEGLKSVRTQYPSELLAARREAFMAQIGQYNNGHEHKEASAADPLMDLLGTLKSSRAEYPSELLAARRAAFVAQIQQHNRRAVVEKELLPAQNDSLDKLFGHLKSIKIEYPLKLWSARRSSFVAQIREGKISVLEALHSAIYNFFHMQPKNPSTPAFSVRRTSMILVTLLMAAFVASLTFGNRQPLTGVFGSSPPQQESSQPGPVATATNAGEVVKIICPPGHLPPLCLEEEAAQSQDLTDPENGFARPAVAKDTLPSYGRIHDAAYVNDGKYGHQASWISNSAYSWIKIDLGDTRTVNTITFSRDRLGNLNDGDPGQFVISVALHDDVYADGNSHNDYTEYLQVYDSEAVGFDGVISGPETIAATFDPVEARFIKITFEKAGTAVDEIEAFMLQPHGFASNPTHRARDTLVPPSFTPIPTNTLVPSKTPTLIPTNTLIPTRTQTLVPTNTLVPTFTPFPTDTNTPRPTRTPRPTSTDTPEPPTATPELPTATSETSTATPELPTATSEPSTATPEPPTATSEPLLSTPDSSPLFTNTPDMVVP